MVASFLKRELLVRDVSTQDAALASPQSAPKRLSIPSLTLAEADEIPVETLVRFALRDGRRPRPIYTAHKWFARRLPSVFRSLLIGVTSAPGADFESLYYGDADLRGLTVLDPFVGGGTSVFEALRLGASVHGCDVDPVACAVSQLELDASEMPDMQPVFEALKERVGRQIGEYHRSGDELVLHHFWVQHVNCAHCATNFDAHPNYVLADDGKVRYAFCAHCDEVVALPAGTLEFDCSCCGGHTICGAGLGKGGRSACPSCGHSESLIERGRREGVPEWRLFAVETIAKTDDRRVVPICNRVFRRATDVDRQQFKEASVALAKGLADGTLTLPQDPIEADGWSDNRLLAYGYRRWTELFNDRQLLHLALLMKEIRALEEPVRTSIAMAFSDHLTTNCMMASYAHGWRRLTPLFSVRAFRHIQRPVELNPWVERTGRGSFPNTVRKLGQAAAYARAPKEPTVDGEFVPVALRIPKHHGTIHLGSARSLKFLADASVDVVMTDPPYFDNIAYSELAQFFTPWLSALGVINSLPRDQVTTESLVARKHQPQSVQHYISGLGEAFSEIERVLRPKGIVAFSYRHTEAPAWLALAEAIVATGLHITRVLPMPGEVGMGLHGQGERGLWDAIFMLRRGRRATNPELYVSEQDIAAAEAAVAEWQERYGALSIPFNAIDAVALKRAFLVGQALAKGKKGGVKNRITLKQALR
ncbi:hypothetical protein [Pseudomonas chlororaphis]|uniref:hypothetical protein n=1 Tax=Pseudomonas chlororaphis TaxID=587753 RepID=UPI002365AE33|nr:hypothetical protein [Pseudomonas chlororaphis]WDH21369.1 hypothetical protein PUP50_25760 [Pseudomonas chlororaphis]